MGYTYQTLDRSHAAAWKDLRHLGTRDFPLGFFTTEAEAAEASLEACALFLSSGTWRGVFEGARLAGFGSFRPGVRARLAHQAQVGPFFVDPADHGQGAALVLMQGMMDEARRAGLAHINLGVDTQNARAIAFYKKMGFRHIATIPEEIRIDGTPRDTHLYRLIL